MYAVSQKTSTTLPLIAGFWQLLDGKISELIWCDECVTTVSILLQTFFATPCSVFSRTYLNNIDILSIKCHKTLFYKVVYGHFWVKWKICTPYVHNIIKILRIKNFQNWLTSDRDIQKQSCTHFLRQHVVFTCIIQTHSV